MEKTSILTNKAVELIRKKLRNEKLTQQDSNYLSRFVRPKLREMASIDAKAILGKIEYNPRARAIESKIKKIILQNSTNISSIIICGSAIHSNYKEYNDIDVIIATKTPIIPQEKKLNILKQIEQSAKKQNLNLDIQMYSKKSILDAYPKSPSLIYQLKDSKVIYGNLKLPKKINLSSLDLKMKLDWSEGLTLNSQPNEILYAIRNAMLVLLILNKKIDNYKLKQNLIIALGSDLFVKLKNNESSKTEKRLALAYLQNLTKYLEEELKKPKWEKIELKNP